MLKVPELICMGLENAVDLKEMEGTTASCPYPVTHALASSIPWTPSLASSEAPQGHGEMVCRHSQSQPGPPKLLGSAP